MSVELNELERQLAAAHYRGDRRAAGVLADQILRRDLRNPAAWGVIRALMNSDQPMADFQRWFVGKYYPSRLKDLESPPAPPAVAAPPMVEAVPAAATPPPAPPPAPAPSGGLVCPKCGCALTAGMIFCGQCGYFMAPQPKHTAELLESAGSKYCLECGTPYIPGAGFCKQCGKARTLITENIDEYSGNLAGTAPLGGGLAAEDAGEGETEADAP